MISDNLNFLLHNIIIIMSFCHNPKVVFAEFHCQNKVYYTNIYNISMFNIDIQFIAESSSALAHYVSGYVTKAERSSMQEIWQEVSDNKSIYSRLWSFGLRSLRFRESMDSMRQVIYCLVITSLRSLTLSNG